MQKIFNGMKRLLTNNIQGPGGGQEVLRIAAPLFISQASETVMLFTDRLFLSKLGPVQMAATMGGGITSFMFSTFFIGLIGYSTAMVARNYGANRSGNCALVTTQSLIISLLAYPLILSCIPFGRFIFLKTGISPEQLKYQLPYFQILMFGSISILLRGSIGSFFSGIGKTRIIMIANVASMVCNVGINYLLVFGKMGFPQLGIRGAAYGTVISGVIGLLILCIAYFSKVNVKQYSVMRCFRYSKALMKELIAIGYPAGLEFFLNHAGFTLMVTAFHSQGTVVASAVTIAFNWDMVSFIPYQSGGTLYRSRGFAECAALCIFRNETGSYLFNFTFDSFRIFCGKHGKPFSSGRSIPGFRSDQRAGRVHGSVHSILHNRRCDTCCVQRRSEGSWRYTLDHGDFGVHAFDVRDNGIFDVFCFWCFCAGHLGCDNFHVYDVWTSDFSALQVGALEEETGFLCACGG